MWVSSDSILGGLTAASILVILVEAAAAVEIIDSKNTEDQSGGLATVAGYERQPKIFGLGISDRTTTVSVIFNTTTFTSTITPTCYTTNVLVLGRVCQATKTILGRRKRDASLIEDGPIVEMHPIVEMDGRAVDYERMIKPQRVSRNLDVEESSGRESRLDDGEEYSVAADDDLDGFFTVESDDGGGGQGGGESVSERDVEIYGLPDKCGIQSGRLRSGGDGRFLPGFLTFLSRVTTTVQTTTVVFATHTVTASVTFKGCTPSDVTTIFPTSCP